MNSRASLKKLRVSSVAAIFGAAFFSSSAYAETISMTGIYAAGVDEIAALQTIAIDDFGGEQGWQLSAEISDKLRSAVIDGRPYFGIYAAGYNADAVLSGYASTEIYEKELKPKDVLSCNRRDNNGKCVDERRYSVDCHELTVVLKPDLRLTGRRGRQIYRFSEQVKKSVRYCTDEKNLPNREAIYKGLVSRAADRVRNDFAPRFVNQDLRVMENTKGLAGQDKDRFREAIRYTKSNVDLACDTFAALERRNPNQSSILYNIGLCAERDQDFYTAKDYYERASRGGIGGDYTSDAMYRITSKTRARQQMSRN